MRSGKGKIITKPVEKVKTKVKTKQAQHTWSFRMADNLALPKPNSGTHFMAYPYLHQVINFQL